MDRTFMSDDFLLNSELAREIYDNIKNLKIYDYHCHLSPKEIAENKVFYNLTELWLIADHYKWRVMRNAGVSEEFITGKDNDYERFVKFCEVLPNFINNPVYHWAHLELKKYFGITLPINKENAKTIWDLTVDKMKDESFSAQNLIKMSNVDTIVTTDDPSDYLVYHKMIKKLGLPFDVLPGFRTDNLLHISNSGFVKYINDNFDKPRTFDELLARIEERLNYFVENGCNIADVSFADFPLGFELYDVANDAFKKRMTGQKLMPNERNEYMFCLLVRLAGMFKKKGIVMQYHIGVERNVNSKRFLDIGPDCGIDSLSNTCDIKVGGLLLNTIEKNSGLPKTICYTLNPNSYYPLASMIGDFAGEIQGKMQLGAAWWFLDHKDGIIEQLKIFSQTSGLGLFNGMLTDSRSFTSYARHDYFRRILSSFLATYVERGEYPKENVINLAQNISYFNAKRYFNID
ncbi:MAG: glucuronate isomerase [Clostridia bacterium]|nr:glucuronate isomerase [Clostridia bacterium]